MVVGGHIHITTSAEVPPIWVGAVLCCVGSWNGSEWRHPSVTGHFDLKFSHCPHSTSVTALLRHWIFNGNLVVVALASVLFLLPTIIILLFPTPTRSTTISLLSTHYYPSNRRLHFGDFHPSIIFQTSNEREESVTLCLIFGSWSAEYCKDWKTGFIHYSEPSYHQLNRGPDLPSTLLVTRIIFNRTLLHFILH